MTIIRGMGPGKASQISEKVQVREKCVRVRSTWTMGESTQGSAWEVHRCHCAPAVSCTGYRQHCIGKQQ